MLGLWNRLAGHWGPAREVGPCQPLLVAGRRRRCRPIRTVRLVRADEVDILFPAAVAMYREEVGVSPLNGDGGRDYRAGGWPTWCGRGRAYASSLRPGGVQGRAGGGDPAHGAGTGGLGGAAVARAGVGTAAMAAVVRDTLRRVAPSVSLYVNDYNNPARRVYARCGFVRMGTFATVLF